MAFCLLTSARESLEVRKKNTGSEDKRSSRAAIDELLCVLLVLGTRSWNSAFHLNSYLSSKDPGGFFW